MHNDVARPGVRPDALWLGAGGLAIALLGVLAGLRGVDSLALLVAVAGGVALLGRPVVGVLLLIALLPIENTLMAGEGLTLTRALGPVITLTWAARKLALREPIRFLEGSAYAAVAGGFLALAALSVLWADYPVAVWSGLFSLVQLYVLSLLVLDLFTTFAQLDLMAKVLVTSANGAAALTIWQYLVGGLRRAGEDIAGGVNGTAVMLMTVLPFGFYLLRSQTRWVWRLSGITCVAMSVVAIVMTFSRMNLMLLPLVLAAQYWFLWRARQGRGWLVLLTLVGALTAASVVPWERVAARTATIAPYIAQTLTSQASAAGTTSGRGYHMRIGLAIARDHPLFGVGYGNYGYFFRAEYQFTVPGSSKLYFSPRSAHSSFVGMLADLGVVGSLAWVGVLLSGLWNLRRGWRETRHYPRSPEHAMVQALTTALLLYAIPYGFYMPVQKEKIFWVLLATTVTAARLAAATARARAAAGARTGV